MPPISESHRVAALHGLGLLDTPPEERFDRIVRLASRALRAPIALVSLVDAERQWCKARIGRVEAETPRDASFCSAAIERPGGRLMEISDLSVDDRFRTAALVAGAPHVRFYAGQPIHAPSGAAIGTLCVMDVVPRRLNDAERGTLRDLAAVVEEQFLHADLGRALAERDASERRKTLLADTVHDGLVMLDASGQIVEWNAAAERMLGSGRTKIVDDLVRDVVRRDGSRWPAELHPATVTLRTGTAVSGAEMGVRRHDGSTRWLRVNSAPVSDSSGHHDGALITFIDISNEIDAALASVRAAQRLELAFERSGIGMALLDARGRLTAANDAYVAILGHPLETMRGRAPREFRLDDDRDVARQEISELFDGSISHLSYEVRVVPGDRDVSWLRAHLARLEGGDSDAAVLLQIEDVTDRCSAEDGLRRSEAIHRATLDALEQGVALAGPHGRVHLINPAARRLLGYDADELQQLWSSGVWRTYDEHGRELALDERPLALTLRTGRAVHDAIIGWKRKDGRLITLRLSTEAVSGNDGRTEFVVVAFSDVTEERANLALIDAIYAEAPVGISLLDHHGRIVRTNAAYAAQVGQPLETLSATRFRPDLPPVTPLAGGQRPSGDSDQLLVRADGARRWLQISGSHISNRGRDYRVVTTADVTERRRLESELRRFSILFEHANDLITVVSPRGTLLYVSPSIERILGYRRTRRLRGGIFSLLHPGDLADARAFFDRVVAGGSTDIPLTSRVRAADGTWRHLEVFAANLVHDPHVHGIMITARDVSERERLSTLLQHQATHDPLTDLANRVLLTSSVEAALQRADRAGGQVAVCYLDLDGFKQVNDLVGHEAGDHVLVEVAHALLPAVRAGDLVARIGGDEFVVLFDPVGDDFDAHDAARRLVTAVGSPQVTTPGGVLACAASAGVAVSEPGESAAELIARADAALQQAKVDGKNRAVLAPRRRASAR